MRVTIEIEDEDIPSHYEIQSCRDTKSEIVKNSVDDPVVVHLQAIDFHVNATQFEENIPATFQRRNAVLPR